MKEKARKRGESTVMGDNSETIYENAVAKANGDEIDVGSDIVFNLSRSKHANNSSSDEQPDTSDELINVTDHIHCRLRS